MEAKSQAEADNLMETFEDLLISASGQGHTGAIVKLAQLYLDNGYTQEAIELLQEAQEIDGNAPFSSGAAAGAMLQQIHAQEAAAAAHTQAQASEPDPVDSAGVLGANPDAVV